MRCIVNVATGSYVRGQQRLLATFPKDRVRTYRDSLPANCPTHEAVPYAFKAYALSEAAHDGVTSLLWCDSCIVPGPRQIEDLWQLIETQGYWIGNNGFTNYEWTADSAYRDLFGEDIEAARALNKLIPHVVATAFGLDTRHPIGREILNDYLWLAQTKAFCGPWTNGPAYHDNKRQAPCGPPDVRGHRHDQTALSVIAWRLGCKLTNSPEWFAYAGGETDQTCLVAKGL
jgi:hypothetical protein